MSRAKPGAVGSKVRGGLKGCLLEGIGGSGRVCYCSMLNQLKSSLTFWREEPFAEVGATDRNELIDVFDVLGVPRGDGLRVGVEKLGACRTTLDPKSDAQ